MLMSKSPAIMSLAKQTSKNNPQNAYSSMDFFYRQEKEKKKRKPATLQDTKKLVTGFSSG